VVELDGGHHLLQSEADKCSTDSLVNRGYQVLRFWDHEVLIESETVLEQVLRTLQSPSPQPSP
jgi:adenine-specific DNA-methyltransferase